MPFIRNSTTAVCALHLQAEYGSTAFRVVSDTYVTDDAGTGIVHQAPAFGEDDFRVCTTWGIIEKGSGKLPCPVDANGRLVVDKQLLNRFTSRREWKIRNACSSTLCSRECENFTAPVSINQCNIAACVSVSILW